MKNNTKPQPQRIDSDFEKEMRELAKIRLSKGLANLKPKEVSMREMTKLLRKTEGWKMSKEELKFKPKRRDML